MDGAQGDLYHCMENGIKGGEHIEELEEEEAEEDQEGSNYKNNSAANILRVHAVGRGTCGALEAIEYLTLNARRVQEEVLAAILIKNAGTEYLSKYQLISPNHNNTNNRLHNRRVNAMNGSSTSTYTAMSSNVRSSSYSDHRRADDDHHDDHKSCISSNGNSCNGIIRVSGADDAADDDDDDDEMYTAMKAAFKKLVPVVTYEDVEPFICRIANGDTSPILSTHPITEFLTSSGTSAGERKLMPTIPEELERKKFLYSLLMPVMNQYLPGLDKGKGLYFLFTKSETRTPGGVLARPVLTSYYKSRQFRDEDNSYTSPTATILCPDAFQSMYCQMLCGLIQYSEVLRMGAVFASAFLRAIKFLEEHWQELCDDIRKGHLSDKITDLPSRAAVMDLLLCPNPELADRITSECSKKSWQGIIARLWPKTLYIEAVVTGTMSQYIPSLDYYSGGLPLVCSMYASSECYFGINLKPLSKPSDVSYTLLPNMGYFEFIPVERSNSNSEVDNFKPAAEMPGYEAEEEVVDLTELKVGKEYELVVTTYAGLYRYKVGDVLRVTGFYNAAPQFQFICRKNVILSIDADKTDEECLHQAVRHASQRLHTVAETNLVEYTSFSDTGTIPGHYVVFWELQTTKLIEPSLLEACCLSLEESLDSVYRQCRNCDRSIGPLEIRLVKSGTFDMLMDYCVSRGSSINQYKTPRCINSSSAVLQLLNSRVTQRAFSPSCPFWAPQRKEWAVAQ